MTKPNYGYSITVRDAGGMLPATFISGFNWEAGRLRSIMACKAGDYVPVWERIEDALQVIRACGTRNPDGRIFEAVNMYRTLKPGGSRWRNRVVRGVGDFVIPS